MDELIGIYDPDSGKFVKKFVPYEFIKSWAYQKKEEEIEINGKKYLGVKVGRVWVIRCLVG